MRLPVGADDYHPAPAANPLWSSCTGPEWSLIKGMATQGHADFKDYRAFVPQLGFQWNPS
jgi:hypothetical protein